MDISRLRKKHRESKDRDKAEEHPETAGQGQSEAREEAVEVTREETQPQGHEETLSEADSGALPPESDVALPGAPAAEAPVAEEDEGALWRSHLLEYLKFELESESYAFSVADVQEVLRMQRFTTVPRAADFIVGITSLRGTIIPVMSLRKRLHIKQGDDAKTLNIVILKSQSKGLIGALVDRTTDVLGVRDGEIAPPPSHLDEYEARFIEGVITQGERFISILDTEELLNFNASGEVG